MSFYSSTLVFIVTLFFSFHSLSLSSLSNTHLLATIVILHICISKSKWKQFMQLIYVVLCILVHLYQIIPNVQLHLCTMNLFILTQCYRKSLFFPSHHIFLFVDVSVFILFISSHQIQFHLWFHAYSSSVTWKTNWIVWNLSIFFFLQNS